MGCFFKGIKQPQIFLGITKRDQLLTTTAKGKVNKQTVNTFKEEIDYLLHYLDKEKPYTNPKLTLEELAQKIREKSPTIIYADQPTPQPKLYGVDQFLPHRISQGLFKKSK